MRKRSPTVAMSWLAGVFENGSISFQMGTSNMPMLRVTYTSVDPAIIGKIHEIAKCGLVTRVGTLTCTGKNQFCWKVHGKEAHALVDRLEPYAIGRRSHIEIAQRFCVVRNQNPTLARRKRLCALFNHMRRLNGGDGKAGRPKWYGDEETGEFRKVTVLKGKRRKPL
jgi:hypothetical protein